jgi:hypothetical protein
MNQDLLFEGVSMNIAYWKTKTEKSFTDQMKVKDYFSGPDQAAKIKEAYKLIKGFGKDPAVEQANG